MKYPLTQCKECVKSITGQGNKEAFLLKEEKGRYIYFSPVGNQLNYGCFADGRTPKIVVMGITTSPTARDNFLIDLNNMHNKGLSNYDVFHKSCIRNIFNSDKGPLQPVLTKILNGTGIFRSIGCESEIKLDKGYFRSNGNDEDYEKVINNIYFTQMIMCASCDGEDGRTAPRNIKDIGGFQIGCIKSQLDFFESFKKDVGLLITFGKINKEFIDKYDSKKTIKNKCRYHVNINHPTTMGWNMIDSIMKYDREEYVATINSKVKYNKKYSTSLINCYDKFEEIKGIVELL